MPYARTSVGYPPEFFQYLDQCAEGGVVTIKCEDAQKAGSLRARWYQFIGALKRDVTNPPKWIRTDNEKARLFERLQFAMAVEVTVTGSKVIIRNRELRNVTVTIDFPNAAPASQSVEDAAAASLARLLAMQEGKK